MSAQSDHPFVTAAFGFALLINVAVVDGPFSAYKIIPRKIHRIIDWVYVVTLVAGAVTLDIDQSTRTTLFGIAIAIAIVALTTNYSKKDFRRS